RVGDRVGRAEETRRLRWRRRHRDGALAELSAREIEQRCGQRLRRAGVGDEHVETQATKAIRGEVDSSLEELRDSERVAGAILFIRRRPRSRDRGVDRKATRVRGRAYGVVSRRDLAVDAVGD